MSYVPPLFVLLSQSLIFCKQDARNEDGRIYLLV